MAMHHVMWKIHSDIVPWNCSWNLGLTRTHEIMIFVIYPMVSYKISHAIVGYASIMVHNQCSWFKLQKLSFLISGQWSRIDSLVKSLKTTLKKTIHVHDAFSPNIWQSKARAKRHHGSRQCQRPRPRLGHRWNGEMEIYGMNWESGWWLSHPSEKYEFVSWDDYSILFLIYGKK